jgi:hypothetical protein
MIIDRRRNSPGLPSPDPSPSAGVLNSLLTKRGRPLAPTTRARYALPVEHISRHIGAGRGSSSTARVAVAAGGAGMVWVAHLTSRRRGHGD